MNLISYDDVLRSAAQTSAVTLGELRGVAEHYLEALNALLRLPYFTGADGPSSDGPEAEFRWWCQRAYVNAGHTCVALFDLWHRGFYLEASILLRHVLEVFVQMRYFFAKRPELLPHLTGSKRVRFRTMFDLLAPGYYEHYYGTMLSGVAHGGMPSTIFRFESGNPDIIVGCKYDEQAATWVINQLTPLLYGLLKFFPRFFPKFNELADAATMGAANRSLAWFSQTMLSHRNQQPQSAKWFGAIGPLVGWPSELSE